MKYILIILIFISLKGSTQAPPLSLFTGAQEYQLKNYVKYVVDSLGKVTKVADEALIVRLNTQNNYMRNLNDRIDSISTALKVMNIRNKNQSDSIKSLYDSLATYVYTVADLEPVIKRIEALEVKTTIQGHDIDILKQYMEEQKKKFLELGLWQPN